MNGEACGGCRQRPCVCETVALPKAGDGSRAVPCPHDPRYSRSECAMCGDQVAWCDRCGVDLCGCNEQLSPPGDKR